MAIDNFSEYEEQTWSNKPDTSTPVSAERLNHMERGIKANSDALVWMDQNHTGAYYVTVTEFDGEYISDKTVAEIEQAYQIGKMIYCIAPYGQEQCVIPLVTRESELFWTFETTVFGEIVRVLILGGVVSYEKEGLVNKVGLTYEDNLLYLMVDGEVVGEPIEIQQGTGGSGSSSTSVVTLKAEGNTAINIVDGDSASVSFDFTSMDDEVSTGDGTCELTVNSVKRATYTIKQGITTLDVTKYLDAGSNSIKIKCLDVYGVFKILYFTINVIDLRITSTFDDTVTYSDIVPFKFTMYGKIEKTIHIVLDDTEVYSMTTSLTNRQTTVNLDITGHGIHTLDAYVTATLDDTEIESGHLYYEVMFVTEDGTDILIASTCNAETAKQGEQISIAWSIYNPASITNDVELRVECGGEVYSKQTVNVDRTRQYWNVRNYPVGEVSFIICSDGVEKSHTVTVTESDIVVEAVTNDMELYLTSAGRTNSELTPDTWTYGDISTTFTGVNWASTGWVNDDNGDPVLRLSGGATAEINFKPFANDWKTYGKTLEFEFAVRDVNNRNAVVIECMDGGIGFRFTADTATLKSQLNEISCNYCEEKKLRVSFVAEAKSEYRLMQIYLNGVLSGATQYAASDIFQQDNPMTIKLGSEYCGIDVYNIRSYTNALTFNEAKDNYIADIADIGEKTRLYEANDIYNEYGLIQYAKMKEKIPVMTIIGSLPQSKGDKKDVTILFEHNEDSSLCYEDTATIDVQGTSSQWYIRKNYKGKTSVTHQHASGQMPSRVFCTKADYAEATGTHNTQNANLVETLYDEKTPAQEADPRCRTTIYGYPIVIFHQADASSTPEFIGKYNYNFDKGSEEVYGFDGTFDVESWEFLNNTSDPCNFRGELTQDNWADSFEARYPDGHSDITRLKAMHDWVVSTIGNVDKFRDEFEDHFDLHYCLIYYVYTSVMLMVDQRAKNMFMTYWADTRKWQPWFYDNDTCLGINNEGRMVFDYYHEDIDQLNGEDVYNGQNSVFWCNFREAFPDEIQECYQELRNDGKLTYDIIKEYFVTNGSNKWSASIYNEDADYKYISMLRSDGDASNLYQVRGTGEFHLEYFMQNRLNYFDSKWYASDYADDYISLRIYTPSEWAGVEPNADIKLIPFSTTYAGVKYKANGTLQQQRVFAGDEATFEAPDETFIDTETAIFPASQISELCDLAPLYPGSVNVSKAKRLVVLKAGDATEGYSNPNLTEVSVGTNRLLKHIDIRNCPNLTASLDLTGCANIQEIYAEGSGITGVNLPSTGGYVKIMHLPDTIINLTLKNQLYIEDLTIAGYETLDTLNIENCPVVDVWDIMEKATNLKRIRLAKVNWEFENSETMLALVEKGYKGVDDYGDPIDTPNVSGTCHIKALTGENYAAIKEAFPYLTITYTSLTSYLYCMAGDQVTVLHTQEVINGADGYSPLATGEISTPTKASDAQYTYTYTGGWTKDPNQIVGGVADPNAFLKVEGDRYIYPVFTPTIRCYDIKFYNSSTLLYTAEDVPYGTIPEYAGDTPLSSEGSAEDYPFLGWAESSTGTAIDLLPVTGTKSYYAVFGNPYELAEITDDWATIMAAVEDGTYRSKYSVGNYKSLNLGDEGTVNMQIVAKDKDELGDGSGTAALTWIAMGLLETSHRMNPSGVYADGEVEAWAASGNTWTSGNRYAVADAEATWTITAETAGTISIKYNTSNSTVTNNTLDLTVNGETVATGYASTSNKTHSVTVEAGDVVTVNALYKNLKTSDYYATIEFSGPEFSVSADIGTTTGRVYTESTGAIGGWCSSEMRTYLKETIKPLIPTEVSDHIVEVKKTQTAYGTDGKSFTQESVEDVWIPDYYEVYSTDCTYKLCYPDGASRIKKKSNGTATIWWLRRANSTSSFSCVSTGGSNTSNSANRSDGVALSFCTGISKS